jgi:DNA-binding LacI/PurR family transcriptional regulator
MPPLSSSPTALRRPTIADVAARAGVSKALVSLALRGEPGPNPGTRERVLAAAAELGYRADRTASLLALRRTRQLGVVANVRNPFQAELVEDLQAAADALGYELALSPLTRTHGEPRAVETLLGLRCEALILLGPVAPARALAELARRLPVVSVGRRVRAAGVDAVLAADDQGVRQAVDHLVALGHRDIVHVDGGRNTIAAVRRRGYRAAMEAHGLEPRVIAGDLTERAGAEAAALLAGGDAGGGAATGGDAGGGAATGGDRRGAAGGVAASLPTAIIAVNDRCAVGVLDALRRAGVEVPGRVSLVGYDDSALAQIGHIDLTTVNQDAARQARLAVEAAVERLESGRERGRTVVLPPRLVVRGTTAPPAA